MTKVLAARVAAALLIATALSPAVVGHRLPHAGLWSPQNRLTARRKMLQSFHLTECAN
jgi:hypothetical protein